MYKQQQEQYKTQQADKNRKISMQFFTLFIRFGFSGAPTFGLACINSTFDFSRCLIERNEIMFISSFQDLYVCAVSCSLLN